MAQCQTVRLRNHPTKVATAGKQTKILSSDFGPLFSATGAHKTSLIGLDISDAIVQITECEIKQQERIGNNVTHLFVNGRARRTEIRTDLIPRQGTRPGQVLAFKTRALFGDPEQMIDAMRDVYILLRSLTRVKSGRAQQAFHFYVGKSGSDQLGKYVGQSHGGFQSLRQYPITTESAITVIGPMTTYGRRLYWNPIGGKKVAKSWANTREVRKQLGIQITGGFVGTLPIHKDVKRRMRRKARYKALSFSDTWYDQAAGKIVGSGIGTMIKPLRMPAITIQMKQVGRLGST